MCAMAVAPREMARDADAARLSGPVPIYVVCSPSRHSVIPGRCEAPNPESRNGAAARL
jgi:hypothetical protein